MFEGLVKLYYILVFILLGVGFIAATFVFPFISSDLLRYTYIAWFILLMIVVPVLYVFLNIVQRVYFYQEKLSGVDVFFRSTASVISCASVVTIIHLILIKAKGVGYIHDMIDHNLFAADGYQGFLTWIKTNSMSHKHSALANVFDFNGTLHWFADILPKPDSTAYVVVFVIAAILAIAGFLLAALSVRKAYLAPVNYLVFSPVLLFLVIFMAKLVVAAFIAIVPLLALLIVGIAMMGAGSNTEKPPRTNTSETNWVRETGDTQRAMYFVDNNCGDYKVLRNEEGDQFRVYSTGEPGKYRDKNNRVFYDD